MKKHNENWVTGKDIFIMGSAPKAHDTFDCYAYIICKDCCMPVKVYYHVREGLKKGMPVCEPVMCDDENVKPELRIAYKELPIVEDSQENDSIKSIFTNKNVEIN